MKAVVGFFFLLLFGVQILQGTLTLIDWKINQVQITNEYCINKLRPELNCEGKCHISKLLNAQLDGDTHKKHQKNNGKLTKIKQVEIVMISEVSHEIQTDGFVCSRDNHSKKYTNHYHFTPIHSFFHPPSLNC